MTIDKRLLAEYKNPLAYMDKKTRVKLRIKYVVIALLLFAAGCALLLALFRSDNASHSWSFRNHGDFATFLLAIGLPPYAVYRLLTIRRSMVKGRREQLKTKYVIDWYEKHDRS